MTAKEARDLPDFAEVTYAITAVFRGEHMDDAAMTVIDRRVTKALRRMYAEGMAKAAEIARDFGDRGTIRGIFLGDEGTPEGIANQFKKRTAHQIAEAILAASPTASDAPRPE